MLWTIASGIYSTASGRYTIAGGDYSYLMVVVLLDMNNCFRYIIFNHSYRNDLTTNVSGSTGNYSAILGGQDHSVNHIIQLYLEEQELLHLQIILFMFLN